MKQFTHLLLLTSLLGGGCLYPVTAIADNPAGEIVSKNSQVNELLRQGRQLVKNGDYADAIAVYERAAALDGNNAKIFSGIGFLQTRQGDYNAAAQAYQKALSLDPGNPDFFHALGYSLANSGDYDNAATAYYYAIQIEPKNVQHYLGLGVVLLRQQNYTKAGEVYQWVLALDPNNQQAHEIMGKALIEQNKSGEALDFLQKALQRFPRNTELQLQLASVLLKQGDLSGGTQILKDLERQSAGNFLIQLKIGILLEKQERFDEALPFYRRAVFLQPQSLEAQAGIGRIHLARKDYLGAIIAYQDLAKIAPNNGDVYLNLGRAYAGRGRKREAQEAFKQARELYVLKNNQSGLQEVDTLLKNLGK
jgi:Flp pilus assembly protein TadD